VPKLDILPFYPILIHTQPQPSTLLIALLNPSHLWPCIGMARTYLSIAYLEFITLNIFAIAHNCAPALTGIISRLRTRLRTPISSVAKYSLRVSIAPNKIIKAQWSSVGTVLNQCFNQCLPLFKSTSWGIQNALSSADVCLVQLRRTHGAVLTYAWCKH